MSDYNDYFFGNEDNGDREEIGPDLDAVLFGNDYDAHAQELMWDAVVAGGENTQAWIDLGDYLWDVYGIDLEAEWDWVDFREWYDAQ